MVPYGTVPKDVWYVLDFDFYLSTEMTPGYIPHKNHM